MRNKLEISGFSEYLSILPTLVFPKLVRFSRKWIFQVFSHFENEIFFRIFRNLPVNVSHSMQRTERLNQFSCVETSPLLWCFVPKHRNLSFSTEKWNPTSAWGWRDRRRACNPSPDRGISRPGNISFWKGTPENKIRLKNSSLLINQHFRRSLLNRFVKSICRFLCQHFHRKRTNFQESSQNIAH